MSKCTKRKTIKSILLSTATACILSASVQAQQLEDREPEAATGIESKDFASTNEYMVVAANPYAAWAGKQIIEAGGSAIDAAVAIQAMLTLVEPQSSGIGGGSFIMYWDNESKKLHTFDGRETAPGAASPSLFVKDREVMSWRDAVVGGTSVGVPGVLKALDMAHKKFGKLEWEALFIDSIMQAKNGFVVSPRLEKLLSLNMHPGISAFPESRNYFKPNGEFLKSGSLKKNPLLATTLETIAKEGAEAFYTGSLAEKIAERVRLSPINPGLLKASDLEKYEAIERSPMCNPYREFKICGMAPPSSGGVTMYSIIKALEKFDLSKYGANSEEFIHLFSQASALAFADRSLYIADLDFLDVSAVPLINPAYIRERAESISLDKPFAVENAGKPYANLHVGQDNAYEKMSTSHISIVDKQGNSVSMTSSIEFMFGSGLFVEGFLLNNQLTDFSLDPVNDNAPVLNRVQANKRPRSAMSPSMVFDKNNELMLVVGSPGGSRIINYVAHTILNVLDFDMSIQEAISLPRITNRNDVTTLEKGTNIEALAKALEARGHTVKISDLNSGLHGILIKDGKYYGGADPRREGVAVGL